MPNDAVIRSYLLGEASEDDALAVEREFFASGDALEAVAAAEWDLIEDYLASRLAAPDRTRFEGHYLRTPAHRTRLAIARGLRAQGRRGRSRTFPFAVPLAAAAVLLLAILGVVWAVRLPDTLRRPTASVVRIDLPLVAVRSEGEAPTVHLDAGTSAVELHLEAGELLPPYDVLLRTVEGAEVWRGPTKGTRPTVTLPAADLPAGDYVVVLEGGADRVRQRYYLRLLRP